MKQMYLSSTTLILAPCTIGASAKFASPNITQSSIIHVPYLGLCVVYREPF